MNTRPHRVHTDEDEKRECTEKQARNICVKYCAEPGGEKVYQYDLHSSSGASFMDKEVVFRPKQDILPPLDIDRRAEIRRMGALADVMSAGNMATGDGIPLSSVFKDMRELEDSRHLSANERLAADIGKAKLTVLVLDLRLAIDSGRDAAPELERVLESGYDPREVCNVCLQASELVNDPQVCDQWLTMTLASGIPMDDGFLAGAFLLARRMSGSEGGELESYRNLSGILRGRGGDLGRFYDALRLDTGRDCARSLMDWCCRETCLLPECLRELAVLTSAGLDEKERNNYMHNFTASLAECFGPGRIPGTSIMPY